MKIGPNQTIVSIFLSGLCFYFLTTRFQTSRRFLSPPLFEGPNLCQRAIKGYCKYIQWNIYLVNDAPDQAPQFFTTDITAFVEEGNTSMLLKNQDDFYFQITATDPDTELNWNLTFEVFTVVDNLNKSFDGIDIDEILCDNGRCTANLM